MLQVSDLKRQ